MPLWSDFFMIFSYSSEQDPLAKKKDPKQFPQLRVFYNQLGPSATTWVLGILVAIADSAKPPT